MILINNFDISSLSSYYELIAAILLTYVGIKNFREDSLLLFSNNVKNKLLYAENNFFKKGEGFLYANTKNPSERFKKFKEEYIGAIKLLKNEYDDILKNNVLVSQKTKPLFLVSFIYCLFLLIVLVGFKEDVKTELFGQFYNFITCFVFVNLSVFIFHFINPKKILNNALLLIILIAAFFIYTLISNYYNIIISNIQFKTITVIIPLLPFIVHYSLEYLFYLKRKKRIKILLISMDTNYCFDPYKTRVFF